MPALSCVLEYLLIALLCVPGSWAWRFGLSISLSGTFEPDPFRGFVQVDSCTFCHRVLSALELWVDHARSQGSLGNFSFDVRDDESNHTIFKNNYEELAQDDSIHFLLGPANSFWNDEASAIAARHGKVLIKWSFDIDLYNDIPLSTHVDFEAALIEELNLQGSVPPYPSPTQISSGSSSAASSSPDGLSFDVNIPHSNWTSNTIDLMTEQMDNTFRLMFVWFADAPASHMFEQQCTETARYAHNKGAEVTYLPMHYHTQLPREMSLLVANQPDVLFICGPNRVVQDLLIHLQVYGHSPSILALGRPLGDMTAEMNWRSALLNHALQPVPLSPPDMKRPDPVFGNYLHFFEAWASKSNYYLTYEVTQVVGACSLIFAALASLGVDQEAFTSQALAQQIQRSRTATVLGWLSFSTTGQRLLGPDASPGTRQMLPWDDKDITVFERFTHNKVVLVSNASQDSCAGPLCRDLFLDRMQYPGKLSWEEKWLETYPCSEGCLLQAAVCTPCSRGSKRGPNELICKPCEPGTYATIPGSSACQPCPEGAMCRTGMPHAPAAGYCRVVPWHGSCHGSDPRYLSVNRSLTNDGLDDPCVRHLEPEPFFQHCLPSRVCTGGDTPCIGDNQGLLCGQCQTGQTYTGVGTGRRICKDCPSLGEVVVRLTLLAVFYGVVVFTMSRWALRSAVSPGFMPTPMFRALVHYLHMVSCICENTRLDAHPFLALCLTPLDLFWRPLELVSLDCFSHQSPEARMVAANMWARPDIANAIFSLPIGICLLLCYHVGFALVMYLWNNPIHWCFILLGTAVERAQHSQTGTALSRQSQVVQNNLKSMLENVADLESASKLTPRSNVDKGRSGSPGGRTSSPGGRSLSPARRISSPSYAAGTGGVDRIWSADSTSSEDCESPKQGDKVLATSGEERSAGGMLLGEMPRRTSVVQPRLEKGAEDRGQEAQEVVEAIPGLDTCPSPSASVMSRKRPTALLEVPSIQGPSAATGASSPSGQTPKSRRSSIFSRRSSVLPPQEKKREHFVRKEQFSETGYASRTYSHAHERRCFHVRLQGIVRELLMWVLLTYPTVIRSFMKLGKCIPIWAARAGQDGSSVQEWRVVMDLDVVCDNRHRDAALNFATLLVFILPFTILLFLSVQVTDLANIVYRRVSSIFTSGYKPDAYYWEVLMILRTGAMVRTASIQLLTLRCLAMFGVVVFFFCLTDFIDPFAAMERFALKKFDRFCHIGVMMLIALGILFQEEQDENIGGYVVESGLAFGVMCFVVVGFNMLTFFSAFFWAVISPCCRTLQAILDNGGSVSQPLEYLLWFVRRTYGINKVAYFQDATTGQYVIDASALGWQEKPFFIHCLRDILSASLDASTELHTWLLQRAIHEVFIRAGTSKQAAARARYQSWGLRAHRLLMCSLFTVQLRNPDIILDSKTLQDDDVIHVTVEDLYVAVQDVSNDMLDHNGCLHKEPESEDKVPIDTVASPVNGKPYTVASWDRTEGLNNVLEELKANGKLITLKPKAEGSLPRKSDDESSEEDNRRAKTPDGVGNANELLDEMEREMDTLNEEMLEDVEKVAGENELMDELADLEEEIQMLNRLMHGDEMVQKDSRRQRMLRRMARRRTDSTVVQEARSLRELPILTRPDSEDSCGQKIDELTADQFKVLARVSEKLQAAGIEHRDSLRRTSSPEETTISGGAGEPVWTPSVDESFASHRRSSTASAV